MNLLKQNRQKRATPTNADLSCDSVTPARSRPIGVCLSWAFVCHLAGTAHCSSMLPQVISILDLFLVDVRAIKNNWETDSNWVLAVPRAGVCSQVLQDPWEGWTQGRATCLCQPPARAPAWVSIRQTCNFPLISPSFSMLLTSCPYLLQIICFSRCFTINLYYFCWVFFFFLLISPQEGEGLPHFLCLGNKSSLWICTWGGRSWFPLPASSGQIFEGNCSVQGHLACLITVKSTFIRARLGVGTIEKIFMGKMSFQKTRIWTSN